MADFNVRSDAVDVEQIMRQIRARIREKRGADYTEAGVAAARDRQAREVSRPARRPLGSGRAVQTAPHVSARATQLRVRRHDAVRDASRVAALHAQAAPSDSQALLQSEQAHSGPAHRRSRSTRSSTAVPAARRDGPALLRGHPQPRDRNHAARDRRPQPEDARRVAVEPDGFRRAARAIARERRAVSPAAATPAESASGVNRPARTGQPARTGAQPSAGGGAGVGGVAPAGAGRPRRGSPQTTSPSNRQPWLLPLRPPPTAAPNRLSRVPGRTTNGAAPAPAPAPARPEPGGFAECRRGVRGRPGTPAIAGAAAGGFDAGDESTDSSDDGGDDENDPDSGAADQ